ncbi:MAG: hypothetical protein Q8Q09_28100 [Deltaproteobacteria bacterium]|nr:hypothetical protein [Deltaproteobacteria bacterium]
MDHTRSAKRSRSRSLVSVIAASCALFCLSSRAEAVWVTPPAVTPAERVSAQWFASLRASVGASWLAPAGPLGVSGELTLGARRLVLASQEPVFDLLLEGGYAWELSSGQAWHLAMLGVSPGVGVGLIALRWSPRFVLGSANGDLAVGMRNGVAVGFLRGVIEAEVSHQWLHTASNDVHAGRVLLSVDVGLAYSLLTRDALGGRAGPTRDHQR